MELNTILNHLDSLKDIRGLKAWERNPIKGLTSYGIGLTKLKKLAKNYKKDKRLAARLFNHKNYETIILSFILDDAKDLSFEQVTSQVNKLQHWSLYHAYSSILLSKWPQQKSLIEKWVHSDYNHQRIIAYQCLYNIARDNKIIEDQYFEPHINSIENLLQKSPNLLKDAMNNAILSMGKRSPYLLSKALSATKSIGTVDVDYGDNSCQALNVADHLLRHAKRKNWPLSYAI